MSKNNKQGSGKEKWNRIDPAGASDGDIQRVHDELVRDKESPKLGFSPVPIFLVFLISGLIVFCGIYMVWRSDDFDQLGFDETRRRFGWEETGETATAALTPIQMGERVFNQNCVACHQKEGQGIPGAFPPLDDTRWVHGPEERLIGIVLNGLTGAIEVKGTEYNGMMPPLGHLSDEDVAHVLTFVRQAWTNESPAVEVEAVTSLRASTGSRGPWTAAELETSFPE